jgi:hypothetical protein
MKVMRLIALLGLITAGTAGCGFDRLEPTLPDAVAGFTLADLEDIQDDERLTDDEKRELIREAVGAPDDESGDRLVEFLLDLNVP